MVWDFYNLTATQILREIKFCSIETVKNVNLAILEGLNFDLGKFVQFFNAHND